MQSSSAHAVRRWLAVVVVSMLAVVAGACGSDDTSSSGSATIGGRSGDGDPEGEEVDTSAVRLRVGVSAQATGMRVAMAEASGAFEGVEYEIEWSEWETTSASIEALTAGAIDVALAQQTSAVALRQGSATEPWTPATLPFVVVTAEVGPADPGFQLLVPHDSDIRSITDLVGKRISFAPGSQGHYFLIRLIDESGLSPDDFELVELVPSEGRAAFIGGSVDAMVAGYRNAQHLYKDDFARSIGSSGDLFDALQLSVVRAGLLNDPARAAAVADLLKRVEVNHRWHHDNIPAVARMHEDLRLLGPDEALASAETEWNARVVMDETVVAALQDQADVFFEVGMIPRRIDVSIMFDTRFDDDVDSRAGSGR